MKLEIVSPDGILFEGETESVSFPGVAGSFDILPHHAPLIAALKAGTIRFEANDTKRICRGKRRHPIRLRRIKTYDNEWQIKNEVNGFDHVYQRGNRRFIGWFIIYHLAGTLFLVVSVHSLLLLGHGHGDDFLPRPGKK